MKRRATSCKKRSLTAPVALFALLLIFAAGVSLFMLAGGGSTARADTSQVPWEDAWVTDGTVYSIQPAGNVTYIGGDFTYVGPNTGRGVPIDVTTSQPVGSFPRIDGTVRAVVSDGSGGWYVGGDFTLVGDQQRLDLAHIASDGSVTPFNPGTDGVVYALALSADGSILYVGGYFFTLGGANRHHLAAVRTADGVVLDHLPWLDSSVYAMVLSPDGTVLYLGGEFSNIGGVWRMHLAALRTADGSLVDYFAPDPDWPVFALALSSDGAILYAGGDFSTICGEPRSRIASIYTLDGSLTSFRSDADGRVSALARYGSVLFAGGSFHNIGGPFSGQPRNYIAALDASTGSPNPFDPNADAEVNVLWPTGSRLFVGGAFTRIGGQSRNRLAALDPVGGGTDSFNPDAGGQVYCAALAGNILYAGGSFVSIGGQSRNRLAAIDAATGQATSFNPGANGVVYALEISPDRRILYAGGDFTSLGGDARNRLAAIDTSTGQATSLNPGANGVVYALELSPDGLTLYVGGDFTSLGGQSRNRLGAVDTASGQPTGLNPYIDLYVCTICLDGDKLYLGGNFTQINGYSRWHIGAIDVSTGMPTSFDPSADSLVCSICISGNILYAGGNFSTIGGQPRSHIAAVDVSSGEATAFDPGTSDIVWSLCKYGDTLYVGGDFHYIGGQFRDFLAAIDVVTGEVGSFNPGTNGRVCSLALSGSTLFVGGNFYVIGGTARSGFAAFLGDYTVDAVVASGMGTVAPSTQQVTHGEDATPITITPETGWHISSITDNGAPVTITDPSGMTYTIHDVTEDHAVLVTFQLNTYTVTASVSSGQGTALPASQQVTHGEDATPITITPEDGWHIASVTDNGNPVPVTDPGGMTYTVQNVTSDHDVQVTFVPVPWYFAEGYTGAGVFEEWLCLMNPDPAPTTAHITYMFSDGSTQTQDLPLGPTSRTTVNVNQVVGPDRDVSVKITSDAPIVAERPMYFNYKGIWTGGHDVIGYTP